jgi:hypothetical protein
MNKQETLEEAAERYIDSHYMLDSNSYNGFIEGAKSDAAKEYWFEKFQQEQDKNKYSEEEVYELLLKHQSAYRSVVRNTSPLDWSFDIKQWFEQFKKK